MFLSQTVAEEMDQIQNQNSAAMHVQAAVTRLLQLGNVEQATALWNQYLRQTAHLQLQPPQFGLLVPPFMAGPQQVGPGPVPVRQQQANQAPPIPARPKAAVAAKNEKAEVILDDEDEPVHCLYFWSLCNNSLWRLLTCLGF